MCVGGLRRLLSQPRLAVVSKAKRSGKNKRLWLLLHFRENKNNVNKHFPVRAQDRPQA